ncbi:MAG: A/G-specific adenine glycosylase [Rhodobacterales bacterium]|nr:A/G-specific adenine glycosylase [Rhodobacterales bacterium]NCT13316.1 A/G-specific adenine glycosylase [Rhodobacterales bacterium]
MQGDELSRALLAWYDRHARVMPWRVGPAARAAGVRADPYRVWLSEVMLQQTTVAAVRAYFDRFTTLWPTVEALAAAPDADVMAAWAGLGYYARARNLLKCARAVAGDQGGRFPASREELLRLPGIGPYTASAIAAIAFDEAATVVDGNVERVMARLYDIHTPLPAAKDLLTARAAALTPQERPGDHAQAVMDLGATICTPRSPACGLCPWRAPCAARAAGTQAELPRKTPKKVQPVRRGYAYVARRADGAWLLETRPDSGLLGGMLGFPCSDWSDAPAPAPPVAAEWQALGEEARHTFTHFHLRLSILVARLPQDAAPARGTFHPAATFRPAALPTVMRKVHDLAAATLRHG